MSATEQEPVPPAPDPAGGPGHEDPDGRNMMAATRRYAEKYWPYSRLMPSDEPGYVSKMFYMWGSLALVAFVMLILSGCILVFKGIYWDHTSSSGCSSTRFTSGRARSSSSAYSCTSALRSSPRRGAVGGG